MSNEEKNPDADLPKAEEGSNQPERELSDQELEQVSGGTRSDGGGATVGRVQLSEITITKNTDTSTP